MPPRVLVIAGPTATGKTDLSVALAREIGGEVVSADSMQIYRRMDIGTAKPTAEERQGVAHHMIDIADPDEPFSVARYVEMASACVDDILRRGKLPLIVGGTGLYIDSLLAGRDFAAHTPDSPLRQQLRARVSAEGTQALWEELRQIDPEAAQRIHPNDARRIVRALEVWQESGQTISWYNQQTRQQPARYEGVWILLDFAQRADLYARIDARVDTMLRAGLWAEVRDLLASGLSEQTTSMQAIGYKEIARAIAAGGTPEEAAQEIKLRSRQYAKRQLSWFRRVEAALWLRWDKEPYFPAALQRSTQYVREAGLI